MKRCVSILCIAVVLLIAAAFAEEIQGKWAYIHAPNETALELKKDGKAVLDGAAYSYRLRDGFIDLTDGAGNTQSLRYAREGENILLYKRTEYAHQGGGNPDGLIGIWKNAENNWSYQFTEKGTFLEDGYFPGYYTVNEAEHSFKLVYSDHFADTVCCYTLEGQKLTVDYPWPMVRAQ